MLRPYITRQKGYKMTKSNEMECSLCHRRKAATKFEIGGSEHGFCTDCAFDFHIHKLADALYSEVIGTRNKCAYITHVPELLHQVEVTKNVLTALLHNKYLNEWRGERRNK